MTMILNSPDMLMNISMQQREDGQIGATQAMNILDELNDDEETIKQQNPSANLSMVNVNGERNGSMNNSMLNMSSNRGLNTTMNFIKSYFKIYIVQRKIIK